MPPIDEPPKPLPPRYWWLKRLAIAHLVLIAALIGVRLAWGAAMQARLDATVQAIRDRGEPIDLADFQPPNVPDADNAAWHLREALAKWPRVDGQLVTESDWSRDPEQNDDPVTDDTTYLAAIEPSLAHLDRAANAPYAVWQTQFASPVFMTSLSHLGETRRLARLVEDAASRQASAGRHGQAARTLSRLPAIASALRADAGPSLLSNLVAVSIDAMLYHALHHRLSSDWSAGSARFDPVLAAVEDRDAWVSLRDYFSDEPGYRAGLASALVSERFSTLDAYDAIRDGNVSLGIFSWGVSGAGPTLWERAWVRAAAPLFAYDAVQGLEKSTRLIEAFEQGRSWPQIRKAVESFTQPTAFHDEPLLYPISHHLRGSLGAVVRTYAQMLGRRQVMTAALAVWMYEADHDRRPVALENLVPEYLGRVPLDTYAADGRPVAYRPDGVPARWTDDHAPRPEERAAAEGRRWAVVYSVGIDGEDDGGSPTFNGLVYQDMAGFREEMGGDEVVLLDGPIGTLELRP